MHQESRFWQGAEFEPTAEVPEEIMAKLKRLHETKKEFLTQGVFFDVYAVELPAAEGRPASFVFKDFRSGDVTMPPEEQVALFQHQYYEWNCLRHFVGADLFPESYWIRSSDFSDDQAHGFYSDPGRTANTMKEFISVQLDRQLTGRYSSDDKRKGAVKKLMGWLGEKLVSGHEKKPFIGAIVQERVRGVPFAEALAKIDKHDPSYRLLRENVRKLIAGLRMYADENPYGAFTWHGLKSDNVVAETDEAGKLTGRVSVLDANFTERPNKLFKEKVVKKMEVEVFQRLEDALEL